VPGGENKLRLYIPDVVLIEGVFRDAFFLPLLGLIVSLLAFARNVPPCSALPDAARSGGGPRVFCATEFTVSVSTVIFLVLGSALDFCFRLLKDVRVDIVFGRGVLSRSFSPSLRSSSFFPPLSLSELFTLVFTATAIDLRGVLEPDGTLRSSSGMSKNL